MTASDQMTRPPDAPPPGPEWKPVPGARHYEWSHRGKVKSLARTDRNGRDRPELVLKLREDGDGYFIVNYTDDAGVRHCGVSVARMILMAHDPGGYRPGLEACHGPGGKHDNRWPENLRWDTPDANREEALAVRLANNPPRPKPLKVCVRCGAGFDAPGRRCPQCVRWFGEQGARRLAEGMDLEQAAKDLDYPSAVGLLRLAVKHGRLRFVVDPVLVYDEVNAAMVTLGDHRGWLRRVMFRREASRQNSDAQ